MLQYLAEDAVYMMGVGSCSCCSLLLQSRCQLVPASRASVLCNIGVHLLMAGRPCSPGRSNASSSTADVHANVRSLSRRLHREHCYLETSHNLLCILELGAHHYALRRYIQTVVLHQLARLLQTCDETVSNNSPRTFRNLTQIVNTQPV